MIGFAIFAAKKGQSALSCVNKLIQMGLELSVIPTPKITSSFVIQGGINEITGCDDPLRLVCNEHRPGREGGRMRSMF